MRRAPFSQTNIFSGTLGIIDLKQEKVQSLRGPFPVPCPYVRRAECAYSVFRHSMFNMWIKTAQ